MDLVEMQRQCLEWNKEREERLGSLKSHPRYAEMRNKEVSFTRENLIKLPAPKFKMLSLASQMVHDEKEYPIFFIRDRQIKKLGEGLSWAYSGSLFEIRHDRVKYRTTTSFIPEMYLKPIDAFL